MRGSSLCFSISCGEPSFQLVLSMAHRWPDDEMSLHSFQSLSVKWINKRMSDTYKLVWLTSKHTKLNKLLPGLIYRRLLGLITAEMRILYHKIYFIKFLEKSRFLLFPKPSIFSKSLAKSAFKAHYMSTGLRFISNQPMWQRDLGLQLREN